MTRGHVQVVLTGPTLPKRLEAALRRVGATASFGPISDAVRLGLKPTADAVVVIAPEDGDTGYDGLNALFERVACRPRATLVLQTNDRAARRLTYPATIPVSFSGQASEEELAARITTMIEMRPSLDSLHRPPTSAQHADERLAEQYRQQLRLASQVQRELMPQILPQVQGFSFSALHRPADYVSGDVYDVRRLDEEHLVVALADAQGHGICAALLTVFIKRALRGVERENGRARILPPDEALAQLNQELLECDLTESQFVAAVYALLNVRTRRVELARGGAPYPIRRFADGTTELLRSSGILVGVVPDASFAVESIQLAPGESLILYSDGIDQIVGSVDLGQPPPTRFSRQSGAGRRHRSVPLSQARGGAPNLALAAATGPGERGSGAGACTRPVRVNNSTYRSISTHHRTDPPAVAPDESITTTQWFRELGNKGVAAGLEQLRLRHDTLRRLGHSLDDLTVVAINAD